MDSSNAASGSAHVGTPATPPASTKGTGITGGTALTFVLLVLGYGTGFWG